MQQEEPNNQFVIAPGLWLPESALRFSFARSSGPGGQNVNKLNTKAILDVDIAGLAAVLPEWAIKRLLIHAGSRLTTDGERIQITDSTSRSQHANRKACLAKLRQMIIEAMNRPKRRRPTKPSRATIQRRLDNKRHRSETKSLRRKPNEP